MGKKETPVQPKRQISPLLPSNRGRAHCTEEKIPLQLPGRERVGVRRHFCRGRVPFLFNCQSLTDKGREEGRRKEGAGLPLSLCRGRSNERLSQSRATEWNTNSENPQRNRKAKGRKRKRSPSLLTLQDLCWCCRSNGTGDGWVASLIREFRRRQHRRTFAEGVARPCPLFGTFFDGAVQI